MSNDYQKISKIEIATYLSTYFKLLCCASVEEKDMLIDLFLNIMYKDKLIQHSTTEYYNQMCLIHEFFLLVNYFCIKYDLSELTEKEIENIPIFKDIFIDKNDYNKFSKKQIIKYIRNAICHNDKDDRELYGLYRKGSELFIEIDLKKTKPIPFHVRLKLLDYVDIMLQLDNSINSNISADEILFDKNLDNYTEKLEDIKHGLTICKDIFKFNLSLEKIYKKGNNNDFDNHLWLKKFNKYCFLSNIVFARYILDTVVTKDTVDIDNKLMPRNKLRNSLTHGKWIIDKNILQLYDSKNIKSISNYDWHESIEFDCFYRSVDKIYKEVLEQKDINFLNMPISFKYDFETGDILNISCTKKGRLYFYNLTPTQPEDGCLLWGLYKMTNEKIEMVKDPIEAQMFFNELDKIPLKEKKEYSNLLNILKEQYQLALSCELGVNSSEVLYQNYNIIVQSNQNKERIKTKSKKHGLLS